MVSSYLLGSFTSQSVFVVSITVIFLACCNTFSNSFGVSPSAGIVPFSLVVIITFQLKCTFMKAIKTDERALYIAVKIKGDCPLYLYSSTFLKPRSPGIFSYAHGAGVSKKSNIPGS